MRRKKFLLIPFIRNDVLLTKISSKQLNTLIGYMVQYPNQSLMKNTKRNDFRNFSIGIKMKKNTFVSLYQKKRLNLLFDDIKNDRNVQIHGTDQFLLFGYFLRNFWRTLLSKDWHKYNSKDIFDSDIGENEFKTVMEKYVLLCIRGVHKRKQISNRLIIPKNKIDRVKLYFAKIKVSAGCCHRAHYIFKSDYNPWMNESFHIIEFINTFETNIIAPIDINNMDDDECDQQNNNLSVFQPNEVTFKNEYEQKDNFLPMCQFNEVLSQLYDEPIIPQPKLEPKEEYNNLPIFETNEIILQPKEEYNNLPVFEANEIIRQPKEEYEQQNNNLPNFQSNEIIMFKSKDTYKLGKISEVKSNSYAVHFLKNIIECTTIQWSKNSMEIEQVLPVLETHFSEKEFDLYKKIYSKGTSQKHRNFVAEPMGEKPVTELAGIGDTLGGRLKDSGFDRAYTVLGQFLILKKDEELFKEWMKDVCNASSKQASDCYQCLSDWCEEFL